MAGLSHRQDAFGRSNKKRRPSRTDPQRAGISLPLLPSGSDGVHENQPCGARPGRHGVSANPKKISAENFPAHGCAACMSQTKLARFNSASRVKAQMPQTVINTSEGLTAGFLPLPFGWPCCHPNRRSCRLIEPDDSSQSLYPIFNGWQIPSIKNGGERGIRTLGTLTSTHAFQACSFNHSDISPDYNLPCSRRRRSIRICTSRARNLW